MMAQLSHSAPFGRSLDSIIGVRCAGQVARYSGVRVLPKTSRSLKSSPAARRKTRAVMLLTLGLITLSVVAIEVPPLTGLLAFQYGFFGARSADSDDRLRSASASMASARCTSAML